ncbi:MAG: hypothetical protein HKN45_06030 [Flavobacteriales bacterium]|nr:hypothetical protein [Flavobacteriales bacterium]
MAEYNEVIAPLPYFGNVGFYSLFLKNDMLIDVHENYVKQSLRNRCELVGAQGRFTLTVPVHRPSGQKTPMCEIRISYAEDWRDQHRKSFRSAYGSSPYFLYYWDIVSKIWDARPELLVDLNGHAHETICSLLGIESTLRFTDEYVRSTPGLDLRDLSKTGRIANPRYIQVFEEAVGFEQDLSVLDLLFCLGPEAEQYLLNID